MTHRIVSPGELSSGQLVTVLEGTEAPAFGSESVHADEYAGMRGLPFKVVAVDLPFACLEHPGGQRIVTDTRRCQLMELSETYWSAVAGRQVKPPVPEFAALVECHNKLAAWVKELDGRVVQLEIKPAAPVVRPWWQFWK